MQNLKCLHVHFKRSSSVLDKVGRVYHEGGTEITSTSCLHVQDNTEFDVLIFSVKEFDHEVAYQTVHFYLKWLDCASIRAQI